MAPHASAIQEEQRVRAFIETRAAFSETAASLGAKLKVDIKIVRRVLNAMTEEGELKRRTFERGIEAVYYRYQAKAS